ncbi:MAG: ubiquitin-like small modifier protein 1 [Halanaeroarchaeum sp.]
MEWKLFADLSEAAGAKRVSLDLEGDATVGDAVAALVDAHPDLADRVYDADGALADHLNVLRNGQNVFAAGDGLETPVEDDDELAMFPPVSGGCTPDRVR